LFFLLGLHAQRAILKLNLRWKLYQEYFVIRNSYKETDLHVLHIEKTANLLGAMSKISTETEDSKNLWFSYIREEENELRNFEMYFKKLK
jgi:hypothetical protein